ncbi:tetratricopeptide repeat protein [Ferrovibrio xuzhouensis]|uniref:Tetratricopeptide repeat protein n=1 Tax=Ferrovibrio xuzhouensis TaxID=1576914 RepID=A0ABV7VHL1_9PROT
MTGSMKSLLQDGVRRHQAGDLAAAQRCYEAVLAQQPDQPDALHLLGLLADHHGDHLRAIDLIGRAIAQVPDQAEWHGNLATALLAAGRPADAEVSYKRAVTLDPRYVEGHYNLANLLRGRGDAAAAAAEFEIALALQPGHVPARNNLAMLLWEDLGDTAAAGRHFRLLLALAPNAASVHMNYGLFRLSAGAYAEGWVEYEWRWRNEEYDERDWGLGLPRWDGAALKGGGLLLWGEQGVGDQILYGTMLRDAAARSGARVAVAVDPRLVDLFRRSLAPHGITVVARGTPIDAAAQCPFGSLGRWLRREAGDFAAGGIDLVADETRRTALRARYQAMAGDRRLVGLSWRSTNRRIGVDKSIPVHDLLPALRQPGIQWISLQYGDCAEDLAALRGAGIAIHDDPAIDGFRDLDGFAAQVAALDDVVTVSNTTVHVAGGLGVPCRLLLPAGRGRLWYWPVSGNICPWYRSVRITRQTQAGDWTAALAAAIGP